MKKRFNKQIVIYQGPNGGLELKADAGKETIWATQGQIARIFCVERSVITKHIRNILNDKELDKNRVCAKFAHTADDGKTYQVQFYNLDIILAVGFRLRLTIKGALAKANSPRKRLLLPRPIFQSA